MKSAARSPRGAVKINGRFVKWLSWEVNNNTFYQADTFSVVLPISGQPEGIDLPYWGSVTALEVEIFAGFPKDPDRPAISEMESLILGAVDDINIDPVHMRIELTGRDYTSKLIDDQTTNKWQNMKTSDIVTMIAESKGLKPVVTPTRTRAGVYYNRDHAKLDSQRTKWDVICSLARAEGYQAYVRGTELHFEPQTDGESDPYLLEWDPGRHSFAGMDLKFSRSLTLAKDIIVYVRSYNSKSVKGFTKKAQIQRTKDPVLKRRDHSHSGMSIGEPQVYSFVIPNLTPEQALNRAEAKLKQISSHEMRMSAILPGDNELMPNRPIKVTGTGVYEQIYYADSVIRRMDTKTGYIMELTAKNHNTDSYKVL